MKKIILQLSLFIFSTLFGLSTFSQNWVWSGHASGTSDMENVTGIDLDDNGNVYVTGTFGAGATLNGSSLTTTGEEDIFVAKYTSSGTLAWVRTGGSPGKDLSRTIVVDDLGNTYVTGLFVQSASFDSLSLNDKGSRTLISYEFLKRDVFIAKYNTNGQMLWVRRVAWGLGNDVPEGLSIDVNNDLILSGTFKDSLIFSNTDTLVVEKGNINGYIAKYNSNGDCIWTKHTIHTHVNTKFLNISATVNDQIYLAGFLTDTMLIDTYEVISRSAGSTDIILMKINEDGDIEWIRKAGSTGHDRGNSVYADPFGSVFITGYFSGTANFDSLNYDLYDSRDFISKGNLDMFVAKYNNTGTLQWVGTNGSTGEDIGYGLYANEDITLSSGSFSNTVIFGKDTLTSTGGEETGFFVFDKGGAPIYGSSAAGDGEDRGAGLVFDEGLTQTTIMGYFKSTNLALLPLPDLTNPTPTSSEGFIAAYDNPIRVSFVEQSDPLCNGTGSGYLVAQTFFGAEPITYSWSHDPLLTGPNATNLPAGTYKVVVEDATQSKDSVSITLVDPTAIVNTVEGTSILDLTCPEDNNGTINITTTGGAGGYTYTWSGTGSGVCVSCQNQINLSPGEYYVEVEDLNGCIKQDTFTITRPDPITFGGSTVIDIKINDPDPDDPGAVYLVTNRRTPTYSYAWTGPGSFTATTDTIENLTDAGNYQVIVTDDSSCNADTTFLVRSDTAFVAYISFHQNVICKGAINGILEVEVENGTAPFTYDWRDQFTNPAGTTKRVENLPPNTYTVTVTDDNGKTAQASSQIKEPINALSVTKNVEDPSCFGYCDGLIDLNVTGGWGEYTYIWTPGNITTEDLINLCSGTYSCVVTDKEGCQFVTIPEIVVDDPELFVLDNISINTAIVCAGDQIGELEAHHTGGTATYTYLWDDANNQETNPAVLLAAREDPYNVIVTDFKGCKVEGSKLLTEPADFEITSLSYVYPSSVGSNDASITVHAEGGTSPYQYRLNNGALQSDSLFANLSPDTDTVFVVDNNMCGPAVKIFTIPDGPLVIDSIDFTNVRCDGENNDGICVYASGGLGTLSYQWTGGPSTQCYENISTGDYTIVITDSNLVSIDSVISVSVLPAFTLVQVDKTWDGSLGTITVTISGGTPDYTYSLVGPSPLDSTSSLTSIVFENLAGGDYTITVDDANNCGPLQEPVNVSIDNFYIGGDLKLYPNPSTGKFTIEFENSEAEDVMLEIVNISGQMIYKKLHKYNGNSRFNETIDLGNQASGTYFMRINGLPVKAKLMIE